MNKGKKEWPANLGSPLDRSTVSKLTKTNNDGLNLAPLTSYLKPKKGFLAVEKSILANPFYPGMGEVIP
jgi:hypothetical protein